MIRDVDNAALGQVGSIFVTGTEAVSVPPGYVIIAITILESTKFRVLTAADGFLHAVVEGVARKESDVDPALAYSHPQGSVRLGRFTAVSLHEGACDIYLAREVKSVA